MMKKCVDAGGSVVSAEDQLIIDGWKEKLLQENPTLRDLLNQKMDTNKVFAESTEAQLDFIYKNSPYYESAHLKLPVYKVF